MDTQIRQADSADYETLAQIIRESFCDVAKRFALTPENCPTHPSNCQPDWIEAHIAKGAQYYLLQQNGRAIGCVAIERPKTHILYLERLSVLPDYRHRGYGVELVNFVFDHARQTRIFRVEIALIAEQTDLRRWYERRGFSASTTRNISHLPFQVLFMHADVLTSTPT